MYRRRPVLSLVPLLVLCLAAAPATQPDPQQKAAVAKWWADQLNMANKYLALKGSAAKGVDRVGLWLQKAEALIQTSQFSPAAQALEHAAAEPAATPDQADAALAFAELVRHCDRRGFHPMATRQQPNPPTYPILDPADRPAAFAALWEVESNAAAAAVEHAKAATDGSAIVTLAKGVAQLRPLDKVVNKSTARTDDLAQTLATNFAAAAQRWATGATDALIAIQQQAAEDVTDTRTDARGRQVATHHPRGVSQAQQQGLQKYIDTAQQLATAYTDVSAVLPASAKATLEPMKAAVQKAYDMAKGLRNTAYHTGS